MAQGGENVHSHPLIFGLLRTVYRTSSYFTSKFKTQELVKMKLYAERHLKRTILLCSVATRIQPRALKGSKFKEHYLWLKKKCWLEDK
jgi:hypothetical protein